MTKNIKSIVDLWKGPSEAFDRSSFVLKEFKEGARVGVRSDGTLAVPTIDVEESIVRSTTSKSPKGGVYWPNIEWEAIRHVHVTDRRQYTLVARTTLPGEHESRFAETIAGTR